MPVVLRSAQPSWPRKLAGNSRTRRLPHRALDTPQYLDINPAVSRRISNETAVERFAVRTETTSESTAVRKALAQLEARGTDELFQARLKRRLREDREVLKRLAE